MTPQRRASDVVPPGGGFLTGTTIPVLADEMMGSLLATMPEVRQARFDRLRKIAVVVHGEEMGETVSSLVENRGRTLGWWP